jgi:Iap family predicted aminopeptidase
MIIARSFRILVILHLVLLSAIPAQPVMRRDDLQEVLSTLEQIKEDTDSAPCKSEQRLDGVKSLFEKMGASATDLSVESIKKLENLVVRKLGDSNETIVIGAHYDKTAAGCGAIDNWTGIVALAHVYKALKQVSTKKSIIFIAFGEEETGLNGSRAFVKAIPKVQKTQFCAMVNLDSFGIAVPQAAENMSSKRLIVRATELAKELNILFAHAPIPGGDSDSTPFIQAKIPAITLHGLSNDWPTILHTENDQVSKVEATSVYLGYRLALALVLDVSRSPCEAWR